MGKGFIRNRATGGVAPALIGTATPENVVLGRTFYNDSYNKQTGLVSIYEGSYSYMSDVVTSWQTSNPGEGGWMDITYGKGMFVAVSKLNNKIAYSLDAKMWNVIAAPVTDQWQTVQYGNGKFIAVGWNSTLISSTDGINWISSTPSGFSGGLGSKLCYGNGLFVLCKGANGIITSPDGVTWTARTVPISQNWEEICYANGQFMAVSSNGSSQLMTSLDGITWVAKTIIAGTTYTWTGICGSNGICIAIPNNMTYTYAYSLNNGDTWTLKTLSLSSSNFGSFFNCFYGNGVFTIFGTGGNQQAIHSVDGINWIVDNLYGNSQWGRACYGKGMMVIGSLGSTGAIAYGELTRYKVFPNTPKYNIDIGDWKIPASTNKMSSYTQADIAYGNGIYMCACGSYIYTSPDGKTWTQKTTADVGYAISVRYGKGVFAVNGTDNYKNLAISTDNGVTWTLKHSNPVSWYGFEFLKDRFILSGNNGIHLVSLDGITWEKVSPYSGGMPLQDICYNGSQFMGVGSSGGIYTSTDGKQWIPFTSVPKEPGVSSQMVYGNGIYVAAGGTNTIFVSKNAEYWLKVQLPRTATRWHNLRYQDGLFFLYGFTDVYPNSTNKEILTSIDGINWSVVTMPLLTGTTAFWNNGLYRDGKLLALAYVDQYTYAYTGTPYINII